MKQVLVLFFFLSTFSAIAQKADLVLLNGKIFTSDKTNLYVEALAIKSNKIIAIGKTADIEKLANNSTKKIDLQGILVIEVTIGPSVANSSNSNRFELDKISATHPIRLLSYWGHVGIYNTLGLLKMGI
jgi:predicted amidohydrolase YtcJ